MTNRMITCVLAFALSVALAACGSDDTESPQDEDSSQGAASAAMAELPTDRHPDTTGWTPLFASDLSNAALASPESWAMDGGVLVANDRSTIWSDAAYGDFVLDFEARVPDGTNSGVFFRTADTTDILSALELQMHNPPGEDSEADAAHRYGGKNGMAAMYDLKGPSGGSPNLAGEWNQFTITAQDSMIYVVMNGEQVHAMNLNEWTEPGMTPDGEEHKFDRAMMNQAESGLIGFQGIHSENGVSAEYRNLKIQRLGS